ncbi:acetyl-CoA C-acyltransferase [Kordiimonas sp.]|uniref:acetyl-CoA C-acyltransferase n=1 Tax=Kordiimonas sp. TaxID=1970157 RepID=UPI003A915733
MSPVFILDALRTPRGKARHGGGLSTTKPVDMVATLLRAVEKRTAFPTGRVEDVLLGCVTQIGDQGGNVARTAVLVADWPAKVPGLMINRFCTSGLDAAVLAGAKLSSGMNDIIIAGGVEAMSRVPILSDNGAYYADPDIAARAPFVPLGIAADLVASLDGISRQEADAYAVLTQARAADARSKSYFTKSLIAVPSPDGGAPFTEDETIRDGVTAESLAALEPSFDGIGAGHYDRLALARFNEVGAVRHIHTPGNSPAMADGASLLLMANQQAVQHHGFKPRARLRSVANTSVDPVLMLTGGIEASKIALTRAGMTAADIDLVEFNEAFAAVTIKFIRDMGFKEDQVNVNGGAIALGHAMGATGTSLIGTVLDELERRGLSTGLVAISGGAGVGTAVIIERV